MVSGSGLASGSSLAEKPARTSADSTANDTRLGTSGEIVRWVQRGSRAAMIRPSRRRGARASSRKEASTAIPPPVMANPVGSSITSPRSALWAMAVTGAAMAAAAGRIRCENLPMPALMAAPEEGGGNGARRARRNAGWV